MTAIRCPVCAALIGERNADGGVIVKRGGQVVAIDPRVIPCRSVQCYGFVEIAWGAVARSAAAANGL